MGAVAIAAMAYPKHPLFEGDPRRMMGEVLDSSFCGRFSGRFDDLNSDAGTAWSVIEGAAGAEVAPGS